MIPQIDKLFAKHFVNKEYDCIEEYNAEVLRYANEVRAEVKRVERGFLKHPDDTAKLLGIKVVEGN